MSSFDNIPADLLVTVTFQLVPDKNQDFWIPKTIQHVNVRELVAGIRRFSMEESKLLIGELKNPTQDDIVRKVFSLLVSDEELFMIDGDVLSCNLLSAQANTAAQSVLCLLRSIIEAQKENEAQKVKENIAALFTDQKTKAEIALPSVLSKYVSSADIDNWLRSH